MPFKQITIAALIGLGAFSLQSAAAQCLGQPDSPTLGERATPQRLEAIRIQAGASRLRLEKPDDMFNLRFKDDRVRVLVDDQDKIIEIVCG